MRSIVCWKHPQVTYFDPQERQLSPADFLHVRECSGNAPKSSGSPRGLKNGQLVRTYTLQKCGFLQNHEKLLVIRRRCTHQLGTQYIIESNKLFQIYFQSSRLPLKLFEVTIVYKFPIWRFWFTLINFDTFFKNFDTKKKKTADMNKYLHVDNNLRSIFEH